MACRGSGVRVPSAPPDNPPESKDSGGFFFARSACRAGFRAAVERERTPCVLDSHLGDFWTTLVRLLRENAKFPATIWGCGAAGSAPAWHAGGQGFESPQLHQETARTKGLSPVLAVFLCPVAARLCVLMTFPGQFREGWPAESPAGGKQRLVVTPVLQAGILDPHPGKVADDDLEEVIPVIQVPVPVVSEATSDSERRNSL